MAPKAKKTEHAGAKKSRGAYYGFKKDAKADSRKLRRRAGKQAITLEKPEASDQNQN